jgi:hypothetical protein
VPEHLELPSSSPQERLVEGTISRPVHCAERPGWCLVPNPNPKQPHFTPQTTPYPWLPPGADEAIILGEEMLVHADLMALSCSTLKPFRSFQDPGREPRNLVEGQANKRALHDIHNFAADTRRCVPTWTCELGSRLWNTHQLSKR